MYACVSSLARLERQRLARAAGRSRWRSGRRRARASGGVADDDRLAPRRSTLVGLVLLAESAPRRKYWRVDAHVRHASRCRTARPRPRRSSAAPCLLRLAVEVPADDVAQCPRRPTRGRSWWRTTSPRSAGRWGRPAGRRRARPRRRRPASIGDRHFERQVVGRRVDVVAGLVGRRLGELIPLRHHQPSVGHAPLERHRVGRRDRRSATRRVDRSTPGSSFVVRGDLLVVDLLEREQKRRRLDEIRRAACSPRSSTFSDSGRITSSGRRRSVAGERLPLRRRARRRSESLFRGLASREHLGQVGRRRQRRAAP